MATPDATEEYLVYGSTDATKTPEGKFIAGPTLTVVPVKPNPASNEAVPPEPAPAPPAPKGSRARRRALVDAVRGAGRQR